jgi:hypothetical protein
LVQVRVLSPLLVVTPTHPRHDTLHVSWRVEAGEEGRLHRQAEGEGSEEEPDTVGIAGETVVPLGAEEIMNTIEIKVDGTYPYKSGEGWVRLCYLTRDMVCNVLQVPHLAEHDNGFLNKGYRVVSISNQRVAAIYHHDGVYSLIGTDEEVVIEKFMKTRACLIAPNSMGVANDRDEKCDICYVIHRRGADCPRCGPNTER